MYEQKAQNDVQVKRDVDILYPYDLCLQYTQVFF